MPYTERIIPTNISYLTLGYVTCLTSHHTSRLKVAKSLLKIGQALDFNNRSWVKIPSVIISRSRELIYVNHCLVYRYINMLWVLFSVMSIQHNNPPDQMLHSFQVMASRRKGWSKLLTTLIFFSVASCIASLAVGGSNTKLYYFTDQTVA